MKKVLLTRTEIYKLPIQPFNPWTHESDQTLEEFKREYASVHDALEQLISGMESAEKIPESLAAEMSGRSILADSSRHIDIEILQSSLWIAEVIDQLFEFVSQLHVNYALTIHEDLEDKLLKLSRIYIDRSGIFGWFENEPDSIEFGF